MKAIDIRSWADDKADACNCADFTAYMCDACREAFALRALADVMETAKELTDFGTEDGDTPHRKAHTAAVAALDRIEALHP